MKQVLLFVLVLFYQSQSFADAPVVAPVYSPVDGAAAPAVDVGSIYHHQSYAGKWEATLILKYANQENKLTSDAAPFTKTETSGFGQFLELEYGFNEIWAAGVEWGTGKLETKPDPQGTGFIPDSFTSKGMTDPVFAVNARMDNTGPGTLRWGVPLRVSLGTHVTESDLNSDLRSGATSVEPYVGYELIVGRAGRIGTSLKDRIYLTDRKFENRFFGQNGKRSGGERVQLDVFYEQWFSSWFNLGLDVNYGSQRATVTEVNGVSSNDNNAVTGLGGGIYGTWVASPNLVITAVAGTLGTADTSNSTNVDSATTTVFDLYIKTKF